MKDDQPDDQEYTKLVRETLHPIKPYLEDKVNTDIENKKKPSLVNEDEQIRNKDTETCQVVDRERNLNRAEYDFPPGAIIDGKYRILGRIGDGGMGVVYKVEHLLLANRKTFALKVLHASLSRDPQFRIRFMREVEMALEFTHEHAVTIREFGQTPEGLQYFTMDFSEGVSLRALMRDHPVLAQERALDITRQILCVLNSAHDKGIAHRDLKPENILIENRQGKDHALVLDFGLAKILTAPDAVSFNLTQSHAIVGTPAYMSPEQLNGEAVDLRTDIYAVGVMLYEMLTGRRPFEGNSALEMLQARLHQRWPLPRKLNPDITSAVESIILKAMANDPQKRFTCPTEMIHEIENVFQNPVRRFHPKVRYVPVLACFFVLTVLLGLFFLLFQRKTHVDDDVTLQILAPAGLEQTQPLQVASAVSKITVVGQIHSRVPLQKILINERQVPWNAGNGEFIGETDLSYGENALVVVVHSWSSKIWERKWIVIRALPADPANGALYRAGLERTGFYDTQEVQQFHEYQWQWKTPGHFLFSPVIAENLLFCVTLEFNDNNKREGSVYALDLDGRQKWSVHLSSYICAPPAVVDGIVYVCCDDGLYALDVVGGKQIWKFCAGQELKELSSPGMTNGTLYCGSEDHYLYALDMKTGVERWKFKTGNTIYASPTVCDGVVYCGSSDRYFYALEADTGRIQWKFDTGTYGITTAALTDDVVYFGAACFLYALDIHTGHEKWKLSFDRQVLAPAVANGIVYTGGPYLCAINGHNGSKIWYFNPKVSIRNSPIVAGVVVYIMEYPNLYAVDALTGQEKWKLALKGDICSPLIHNGILYVGDKKGYLYAIR